MLNNKVIKIYTDGSCDNKKKDNGGCGIIIRYGNYELKKSIGRYINTTSARMEIRGVLEALRFVQDKTIPCHIYCDNQYVVKSISEKWAENWEKQEWEGTTRESNGVATTLRVNTDLWKQVLEEIRKFPRDYIQMYWVKGHDGHVENELCDILAKQGAQIVEEIDDKENLYF